MTSPARRYDARAGRPTKKGANVRTQSVFKAGEEDTGALYIPNMRPNSPWRTQVTVHPKGTLTRRTMTKRERSVMLKKTTLKNNLRDARLGYR